MNNFHEKLQHVEYTQAFNKLKLIHEENEYNDLPDFVRSETEELISEEKTFVVFLSS